MAFATTSAVAGVSDRIVLTMPTDARLRSIATLVLGGLGSRLDLPFERTDDLQLAVLSALSATDSEDVTLDAEADGSELRLTIGPVRAGTGEDEGLMRVLSRLVDDVEHRRRDGAEWLTLRVSASTGEEPSAT